VIAGEAGIGKTALVEDAARYAAVDAAVVWGVCVDGPGVPALWPWPQVLAELGVARSSPATACDSRPPSPAAGAARPHHLHCGRSVAGRPQRVPVSWRSPAFSPTSPARGDVGAAAHVV
jgi:hypothetical protein